MATQTSPPRPPAFAVAPGSAATSLCKPHREFIEAQLRLKRKAMAIYQDLVDSQDFAGQYNSVKRFCATLRQKEPEQFDRLATTGQAMQKGIGWRNALRAALAEKPVRQRRGLVAQGPARAAGAFAAFVVFVIARQIGHNIG